jgi:hypothetical protein
MKARLGKLAVVAANLTALAYVASAGFKWGP